MVCDGVLLLDALQLLMLLLMLLVAMPADSFTGYDRFSTLSLFALSQDKARCTFARSLALVSRSALSLSLSLSLSLIHLCLILGSADVPFLGLAAAAADIGLTDGLCSTDGLAGDLLLLLWPRRVGLRSA